MSYGEDARDELAYDFAQSSFDAVERDGYRAEWHDGATVVRVAPLADEDGDGDDEGVVQYNADDLVRAASDPEVRNAREPAGETGGE